MRRESWTVGIGLAAILFTSLAAAEIRIATGNDYAPFTDEDLPAGGLATEIVVEAFGKVDSSVDIDFRPWRRGYHDTLQGLFAGTFPYVYTSDRAEEMQFSSEPIAVMRQMAVSRASEPVEYTGPDSLAGLTICSPQGYAEPDLIQELIDDGSLDAAEPSEIESCIRMMQRGRSDFFIPNNFTWPGLVASEDLDPDEFHVDDNAIAETELFFITPRSDVDSEALDRFDRGLGLLRESGAYDEIVRRHVEAVD